MSKSILGHLSAYTLRTTSVVAVIAWTLTASYSASAQTSSPADANADVEQVTVTATRVVRDGYSAPTPTSVLGEAEIEANAPADIADYVNELPSLSGSATPRTTQAGLGNGTFGINALNLRNLGENRTLVLLDGQRVGASTLTGWVDVNDFPQALVKRVDVVTGGASADWGSDAVAGVVNFVLDKDFTGLKTLVQGGSTTYGDDANYNASITYGTGFLSDRGHILVSVEDDFNGGITGVPRSWYNGAKIFVNPAFTATNGLPQLLALPNVGAAAATPGGIITSGPLKGTYFGVGGTPEQFEYGPIVSGNVMQGGDWQYSDFTPSGDLDGHSSRQNVFARASFNVTDHFQVFAQGSFGTAESRENGVDQFNFGNITIKSDNAFIPPSVATQVAALGLSSFTLGTFNQDLGPIFLMNNRTSWRGVGGANGDFDALGSNWTWDVYGQDTINDVYTSARITDTANYMSAIDSVRNSNGAIVCRSTLTNPNNGCVPYDIFGVGVNTQQARNYVKGIAWGRSDLAENVFAATLHGNPISDWAGPISVATGVEHRREGVTGSNDPVSTTKGWFAGNYLASKGDYDVTEGFFETVVPLAKDDFLGKSLDFNGAIRGTGYSTSGVVETWKLGLTYSPIDDISFRGTRSHDIRAPNLSELFQAGSTQTATFPDPFRNNTSTTAFQVNEGNQNLKPEVADSIGVGTVFSPSFIPGFTFSVDYYNIKITDGIIALNAPQTVNECAAGFAAECVGITRNSAGVITQVVAEAANVAVQRAAGLDFETSYRRDLASLFPFLNGNLTVRGLATNFLRNYTNNGITPPTDTVGTNNDNGSAYLSLPRWRYLATVSWDDGPLTLGFTGRGVSAGVDNTSWVQCSSGCPASTVSNETINNNQVAGAIYFDTTISYDFTDQINTFLTIDNLMNSAPVVVPNGPSIAGASLSANPALYDVIGRNFRVGVRFKM